jgi:RNA polymerase sigma-70 factor (ECF subfamily)
MIQIAQETIVKAARGDMQAFEEIYKAASSFVYTVALRIVNNSADADEVTQDVFIKVHRNLKSFQFRSSFKTWLYRVTTNCAINAYRSRARDYGRRADFDIAEKTVEAPGINQKNLDTQDNQKIVAFLLDKLSPDHRACIVLREIEGFSYDEIAKALNININTVRSRLKRARIALLALNTQGVIKNEL